MRVAQGCARWRNKKPLRHPKIPMFLALKLFRVAQVAL